MPDVENENEIANKTERYIKYVYNKINFNKVIKLHFEPFRAAYYGYLNMVEAGKINAGALLTICDFSVSSNTKRLWVIDTRKRKVLFNTLVAHGQGSGEEFATSFSNTPDSHQSSLGFYTTAEIYTGNNGTSLKLHGQDGIYNSNAYDRAIVIHGADYVSSAFARDNQRIGRSYGCPALPQDVATKIIETIANGSVLFIYHPSKNYLKSSYWLTNKISHLPQDAAMMDIKTPSTNPRYLEKEIDTEIKPIEKNIIMPEEKPLFPSSVTAGDIKNYSISVGTLILPKKNNEILSPQRNNPTTSAQNTAGKPLKIEYRTEIIK